MVLFHAPAHWVLPVNVDAVHLMFVDKGNGASCKLLPCLVVECDVTEPIRVAPPADTHQRLQPWVLLFQQNQSTKVALNASLHGHLHGSPGVAQLDLPGGGDFGEGVVYMGELLGGEILHEELLVVDGPLGEVGHHLVLPV